MNWRSGVTEVVNLATGEIAIYTLPPKEAVKAAYLQYVLKDFNTWDYGKREVPIVVGRSTISCGDWCAKLESRR